MAKMGRPRSVIDWELFEKIIWVPVLTTEHMADMLKVSKRVLERGVQSKYKLTIGALREQKSGPMRHQLFSAMWKSAMGGNIGAQVWLSKNVLGWSDKLEEKRTETSNVDITYHSSWGSTAEPGGNVDEK